MLQRLPTALAQVKAGNKLVICINRNKSLKKYTIA